MVGDPPVPGTVYRTKTYLRIFLFAMSAFALADLASKLRHQGWLLFAHSWDNLLLLLAFPLLSGVALAFNSETIAFTNDSIELRSWRSTQSVPLNMIESYRLWTDKGGDGEGVETITIYPKSESLKDLQFDNSFDFDESFWYWLHSLPNHDKI